MTDYLFIVNREKKNRTEKNERILKMLNSVCWEEGQRKGSGNFTERKK